MSVAARLAAPRFLGPPGKDQGRFLGPPVSGGPKFLGPPVKDKSQWLMSLGRKRRNLL